MEDPCECPVPGFCPRYKIHQEAYPHAVCRGVTLPGLPAVSAEKSQAYREQWRADLDGTGRRLSLQSPPGGDQKPTFRPPPPPAILPGVGTELGRLLAELGVSPPPGCACASRARLMDEWGVEACDRERREEIVAWLRSEYANVGWFDAARIAVRMARSGFLLRLNLTDPAPGLLTEAVRRARGRPVVFDQGGNGIGDGIMALCAVAGWRVENPSRRCRLDVSAHALPWVSLFAGVDAFGLHAADHSEFPVVGGVQVNVGYTAEIESKGVGGRMGRYLANVRAGRHVLPPLRDPARVRAIRADLAGAVVLAPYSAGVDREYSLPAFVEVERHLRVTGYRTVVIAPEESRGHVSGGSHLFGGELVVGASPEAVASVVTNAGCVVGNDSGMAHLAGVLGTPAVALCGPVAGQLVYGCYPSVRVINGPLPCSGCFWQPPDHDPDRCYPKCPSLAAIPPADVAAAVDEILLPTYTGGRSLLCWKKLRVLRDAMLLTNELVAWGDAAEFGVYQGGGAKFIRKYATGPVHLFDTFTGIPADDPGGHRAGDFGDTSLDAVRAFLGDGFVFHPGHFPDSAPPGLAFRFVHVDADTAASTRAAVEYFAPRMVPGGVIVWDDYEWENCPGVKPVIDATFGDRVERASEYQAVVRF